MKSGTTTPWTLLDVASGVVLTEGLVLALLAWRPLEKPSWVFPLAVGLLGATVTAFVVVTVSGDGARRARRAAGVLGSLSLAVAALLWIPSLLAHGRHPTERYFLLLVFLASPALIVTALLGFVRGRTARPRLRAILWGSVGFFVLGIVTLVRMSRVCSEDGSMLPAERTWLPLLALQFALALWALAQEVRFGPETEPHAPTPPRPPSPPVPPRP